jgi:hypothetical protein
LNSTVKIKGIWVIQAGVSGTDAGGDVFFRLDSQSPDFAGSGLHRGKRLTVEGLLLGDSESGLSYDELKDHFS